MIVVAAAVVVIATIVLGQEPPPPPPPPPKPVDTVVLLPEADGRQTAVIVTPLKGGAAITLDKPHAAATSSDSGTASVALTPDQVRQRFGAALGAQPPKPLAFRLYFVEGKEELTEDSKRQVEAVMADIGRRPSPEVIVVGHTDTMGAHPLNDALSKKRAEAIREQLIKRGIAAGSIDAQGRGERELLVPTADNVAEPRNRRVEITVR